MSKEVSKCPSCGNSPISWKFAEGCKPGCSWVGKEGCESCQEERKLEAQEHYRNCGIYNGRKREQKQPLCQRCQQYLSKLNPEPWEKTPISWKEKAKYCQHFPLPGRTFDNFTFYDENKKCLIEKSNVENGKIKCVGSGYIVSHCRKEGCNFHVKSNAYGDSLQLDNNHKIGDDGLIIHTGENPSKNNEISNKLAEIEAFFIKHNIKSIKFDENRKLVVEFDNNSTNTLNTSEQSQAVSYLQALNKQELSLDQIQIEKQKNQQTKKPTNYLPWILGGGGIISLIIGLVWLINKNKKEK